MKQGTKTFRLVFTALMIALGTVLSQLALKLPFGGSITLASMVPLVLLSQLYGVPWGMLSGVAAGMLQLLLGLNNYAYATTLTAVLMITLFDYVLAFALIGLSGLTRRIRSRFLAGALGALIGCAGRYLCHVVSGATVWKEYASVSYIPAFLRSSALMEGDAFYWLYSVCYNGAYMLPEIIITIAVSALLLKLVRFEQTGAAAA